MNKLFLVFTLMMCALPSFSQIAKGNKLVGGSFRTGYTNNTDHYYKYSNFHVGVNPTIGYFISNRIALTLTPGFSYIYFNRKRVDSLGNNSRGNDFRYSIAPSLNYYIPLGKKFYLYNQLSFTYGHTRATLKTLNYKDEYKNSDWSISLVPGIIYFISERVGLETSLGSIGYAHSISQNRNNFNSSPKTKSKGFFAGLNIDATKINFGLKYYFDKIKKQPAATDQ